MKTILAALTFAVLALPVATPMQAASVSPAIGLGLILDQSFDRHGRRCDNPHDIAEHPRCTKV